MGRGGAFCSGILPGISGRCAGLRPLSGSETLVFLGGADGVGLNLGSLGALLFYRGHEGVVRRVKGGEGSAPMNLLRFLELPVFDVY